jgi:hypothetical protein
MVDVFYLAVGVRFFVACWIFARACSFPPSCRRFLAL